MPAKEDESYNQPLINTEKLEELISVYKFPFILSLIGIVFLVVAAGLLIKNQVTSSEVVFTTSASPSASVKIRIDIAGAVMSPGVYEFWEGERIADALGVAGGLSANADREWLEKNLNRAAKLVDGGKIYIPSLGEEKALSVKREGLSNTETNLLGVSVGKIDINSASQAELEALPGIGPVTAQKILSGRLYQTIEELKSKKIVGNAVFEKIKDLITVF